MAEKPLISVLMGIYNCADTLEKAVDCIIHQTYENWELIMCDDGSKDRTFEVAKKLESKDSRIRVMQNEKNMTLAPTLNKCLAAARGEYIARMDGDDLCRLDRFEKELDFLESHPEYALVSGYMELADKDGVFGTIQYPEKPTSLDFIRGNMFCHAAVMVRTDVIRSVNGYSEAKERRRVEDYDLWIRIYNEGFIGYNLQEPLYTMLDDRNATHRRTFENRLNESRVIWSACKYAKAPLIYYFKCLIPIVKWFVPAQIYAWRHRTGKTNQ